MEAFSHTIAVASLARHLKYFFCVVPKIDVMIKHASPCCTVYNSLYVADKNIFTQFLKWWLLLLLPHTIYLSFSLQIYFVIAHTN